MKQRNLVLMVLVSLAASQVFAQGSPQRDAHAGVTGVISSISGSTIRLMAGIVSVDASGADVLLGRDQPGTIADLAAGDLVHVVLAGPGSPLRAAKVARINPPSGHLMGLLEAVQPGVSITLLGINVKLTERTRIHNGRPDQGQGEPPLRVGEPVSVDVVIDGSQLVARSVRIIAPTQRPGESFRGIVRQISDTSWVIRKGDADVTVGVTPDTKIVGDPKVGDEVEVIGYRDSGNAIVARMIVKRGGRPDQNSRIVGTIEVMSSTRWVVKLQNGEAIDFVVNAATKIEGTPKIGERAQVELIVEGSVRVAKSIRILGRSRGASH